MGWLAAQLHSNIDIFRGGNAFVQRRKRLRCNHGDQDAC